MSYLTDAQKAAAVPVMTLGGQTIHITGMAGPWNQWSCAGLTGVLALPPEFDYARVQKILAYMVGFQYLSGQVMPAIPATDYRAKQLAQAEIQVWCYQEAFTVLTF